MSGVTPDGHEPLTPAVLHVLLALSDGPLHGYAVMRRVEEESGVGMGPGTIYGTLERLEDAGLVHDAGEDDGDTRRRRRFGLTSAGRGVLRDEALRIQRLAALTRSFVPDASP
ncbi:MAG: PadR family transcriptional regulator [Gemmatimonadetes bacterium]|nr:PadR family transcriptional regulator [Gemmatimonadota bacterium]